MPDKIQQKKEPVSMSRRKALGLIAGTGVAASVSGAGTYAYLSDEESIESMFEVGSLIIDLTPDNGELNFESMGEDEENTSSIQICNVGSLPVRDVVITDIDLEGSTDVASALEVLSVTYAGVDVLGALNNGDKNGNGIIDLQDLSMYLGNNDVSLESEVSGSGLSSEEGEVSCKNLVITTKMDYSVLPDVENNESVSATVDILGNQQSYN